MWVTSLCVQVDMDGREVGCFVIQWTLGDGRGPTYEFRELVEVCELEQRDSQALEGLHPSGTYLSVWTLEFKLSCRCNEVKTGPEKARNSKL